MKIYGNVCLLCSLFMCRYDWGEKKKTRSNRCGYEMFKAWFFQRWPLFTLRIIVHYIKSKVMFICPVGTLKWPLFLHAIDSKLPLTNLSLRSIRIYESFRDYTKSNKHRNGEKRSRELLSY